MRIFLIYSVLCILALGANLGVQFAATALAGLSLWPSIFLGTGAGLIIKFILDKFFVFKVYSSFDVRVVREFRAYVATGILTTALFWLTEWTFVASFGTPSSQYFGGGLGLTLGYFAKYHLDKQFVFRSNVHTV